MSDYVVIAEREGSSMASVWMEYLCYSRGENKSHRISICMYEGLADRADFYDEDQEDWILPEYIDGKKVVGIDDEIVIGGELQCWDGRTMEFDDPKAQPVADWLEQEWSESDKVLRAIRAQCSKS